MGHLIVTGGSSGIGLEVAKLAATEGCDVTILARRPAELDKAAAVTRSVNRTIRVTAISVDVVDRTGLSSAIECSIKHHGPPTHLVTSAGVARARAFVESPPDLFERMMEVNFFGTVNAVRTVYPAMKAAGGGRIGMIGSGAALVGLSGYTAYASSKFAVRGFAESLRGEARRDGITISIAFPPDTDTPQLHEENLDKPVETRAIAATAKTWAARDVAHVIWSGIEKGRFSVTPGLEMTVLNRMHSLINPILQRYFDRLATRALRRSASVQTRANLK